MADIKISELTQAESLSTSDLLESAVPYNGGFLSRRMSLAQLSNYLENYVQHQALTTTAKTIVSAINEVLGDLANYYTISQTYSKTEVDTLIAGVSGLHFLVVSQLPTTDIDVNTIYLVPKQDVGTQDIYDEFIYIVEEAPTPSHWEKIGTTEIDLSDYVTDTELTNILNDYVTSSGLSTILASYATTSAMTTALADKVDKVSGKGLSTEDYTTAEKTKVNGLATVATSGSYNDLTDKPTIPTVNNKKISITQNGTAVDSFTLNQNSNKTIDVKDEKVKQTSLTYLDDNNYRILLSKSATDSEETDGVNKYGDLLYNPYESKLTTSNVEFASANIHSITTVELLTAQYYFQNGSGNVVAMLEANSSSSSIHPTMLYLPSANGTLALQSDITSAINDLDVASTSISASETLATIKEEDGKVSVTTQDISIKSNQIENYCMVGTASSISSGVTWYKVASTTLTVANDDAIIMFAVQDAYIPDTDSTSDSNGGILYCRVRQGSTVGTHNYGKLKFVANSGLDVNNFRLYYTITSGTSITYEIWTSMNRRYAFRKFVILSQSNRYQAATEKWTLYNSTSPTSAPTESATCVRVECEDNICKQTEIATSEYSNNASRAYAKNELMIWKGDLYRVTSAISSGGAISSKVTATTLSAEIKAIRDALNI